MIELIKFEDVYKSENEDFCPDKYIVSFDLACYRRISNRDFYTLIDQASLRIRDIIQPDYILSDMTNWIIESSKTHHVTDIDIDEYHVKLIDAHPMKRLNWKLNSSLHGLYRLAKSFGKCVDSMTDTTRYDFAFDKKNIAVQFKSYLEKTWYPAQPFIIRPFAHNCWENFYTEDMYSCEYDVPYINTSFVFQYYPLEVQKLFA